MFKNMETHSILKFSSFVFYGNFMSNLYLISENHVIFVNEEKKQLASKQET